MTAMIARALLLAHFLYAFCAADHVIAELAPYVHDPRAAQAIAYVDTFDEPIDGDPWLTEAVLLATAREESTFNVDAIGDHGRAFGLMEIWKRPDLMAPIANVEEGLRQLKVSFAMCPRHPFAPYLSSRCDRAVKQSDRRTKRVGEVLAIMSGGLTPSGELADAKGR